MINEEKKPNGLKVTQTAQKATKKDSDAYYKSVKSKVDSIYGKDVKPEVKPNKYEGSDEEKTFHNEFETLNGLEMTEYDNEPSKEFKDRAKKAISGDSTMGNKSEKGGNTEPVWGSSNDKFDKELMKRIKNSKKKRDDSALNYIALGDDIEVKNTPNKNRSLAFESEEKTQKPVMAENFTHFIVSEGKIIKGYDFNNLTTEEIKNKLKESYVSDVKEIIGESFNSNNVKLHNSAGLAKIGLDENNQSDWANQETEEVNESGDSYPDSYTHFVVNKADNSIITGDDYSGQDIQDIKHWVKHDLMDMFGDELKLSDVKIMTRKAMEKQGIEISQSNSYYVKSQEKQGIYEGKIKSLKFKKPFGGYKKAITLIPESYKTDGRKFEMTDGNEKYLIRWEGNLNEGHAVVLNEENIKLVEESIKKTKHLMMFNSLNESQKDNSLTETEFMKYQITKMRESVIEESSNEVSTMLNEGVSTNNFDKFKPRQLSLNETTKKYAKVEKANYIKEGKNFMGIEYHINLSEGVLPFEYIAKEIVRENKNMKPKNRSILFTFHKPNGEKFSI